MHVGLDSCVVRYFSSQATLAWSKWLVGSGYGKKDQGEIERDAELGKTTR